MMQRERQYSGEGGDELEFKPDVALDGWDFGDDDSMIHKNTKNLEGDHHKSASRTLSSLVMQIAHKYVLGILKCGRNCLLPRLHTGHALHGPHIRVIPCLKLSQVHGRPM